MPEIPAKLRRIKADDAADDPDAYVKWIEAA
jgi:hypothetical protein